MSKKYISIKILCLCFLLFLAGACSSREQKRDEFYNKGLELYEKSDYMRARLEFKNARQIDPKFPKTYLMLAKCEFHLKNIKYL